jgi:dipeptidyl aminopeptidase/acylaminoacyl peptidase
MVKHEVNTVVSVREPRAQKINMRQLLVAGAGVAALLGIAFAIWYFQSTAGMSVIDPSNPSASILSEDEVAKINMLQSAAEVFAISEISPDDSTMIIAAGVGEAAESAQASWMNIQTGETEHITSEFLKLFPQSQVVWADNQTVVYISSSESGDPVVVRLDRATGSLTTEALAINGRVLGIAPEGTQALVEVGSESGLDLMVVDLVTGGSEKLISYPVGSHPQAISWSVDGGKLAIVRYQIPPDLDEDRVNEIATQDALGNLPLAENPLFTGSVLEVYNLDGDKEQPTILNTDANDGYMFDVPSWSPDGRRLLVRMMRPSLLAGRENPVVVVGAYTDRAIYRVYDADLRLEQTLDRPEIEAPTASNAIFASNDDVIVVAAYGLNIGLFHFNLESGAFRTLPITEGTFGSAPQGFQVYASHETRQLVYNQSSFLHPQELYRLDLDGSEPVALTHFNAEVVAANHIRVDDLSIEMDDGSSRSGYLIQPADAPFPPVEVPIVLYQQGGPGGAMTNRWGATVDEPFNLLPNFGIAVLFMPFSGREGFGPDFYRALADADNFGQIDIDEGAQAAQYLIDQHYTQSGGIGITGCSYGGYFAAQSITQYPDLYAAANVQCSVLDLTRWWEDNRFLVTILEGTLPADGPEEYERDSPVSHGSDVKTPVLLFHGMEDALPISVVRDFRRGITEAQTPVTMFAFRGEGHQLEHAGSRLFAAQQQIAWFRKYLQQ